METDPSLQEETSETRRRSLVTDFFALLDPAGKKMLRRSGQGEGRGGVVSPNPWSVPLPQGAGDVPLGKGLWFSGWKRRAMDPAGWRMETVA